MQLTLDGTEVPHAAVVKEHSRLERSALGRTWREVERLVKRRNRKERT